MENCNNHSFRKGWFQLRQRDVAAVRSKIMAALDFTTQQAFRDRLAGRYPSSPAERQAIEGVFAEYGVGDIWGMDVI